MVVGARRLCRRGLVPLVANGALIAVISLTVVAPVAPTDIREQTVRLTGADSPLAGSETALIMGPSGIPIPTQSYADAVDRLFLQPLGFTGKTQILATPEGLQPITGVKSLGDATSNAQDEQILDNAIMAQYTSGAISPEHPLAIFGWSQSTVASTMLMSKLASQGVPSADLHFILDGDEATPNGGVLERFDLPAGSSPSIPSLDIQFTGAEPNDLYPTDVYTFGYDGFTNFPQYPIDLLSDLNAVLGILFDHLGYLGATPQQIADAVQLPTSAADTLTNYFVIPTDNLPLLEILLLIPGIGKPLYDLLAPDMSVLVNVGYGNIGSVSADGLITGGWSPTDADVATPMSFLPPASVLAQVPQALAAGWQQGVTAAMSDLQHPESYSTVLDNSQLSTVVASANAVGWTDATSPSQLLSDPTELMSLVKTVLSEFANFPVSNATITSSLTDIINDLTGTVSNDYSALLPLADTATALLVSMPAYDAQLFASELADGNLLAAIGDPIAADTALIPLAGLFGLSAPLISGLGTLVNLGDLIPGA